MIKPTPAPENAQAVQGPAEVTPEVTSEVTSEVTAAASPAAEEPDGAKHEIERLRRELQERDDVLAMAAHELRNPLHALAMQLTLARHTAEAQGQSDVSRRIAKAQATLGRYTDRVTVLMELVRANAYPISVRSFDLCELLSGLADQLQQEAMVRGIEIRLHLPPACRVESDALAVEQVIDNLLLNALKHSGGSVVDVRLRVDDGWAGIEVEDNGRGISAADQGRIFSKFIVAQEGPRGSGTGLGLWLVRRLLAALGGSITVRSKPEAGSVFSLRFPMIHPLGEQP